MVECQCKGDVWEKHHTRSFRPQATPTITTHPTASAILCQKNLLGFLPFYGNLGHTAFACSLRILERPHFLQNFFSLSFLWGWFCWICFSLCGDFPFFSSGHTVLENSPLCSWSWCKGFATWCGCKLFSCFSLPCSSWWILFSVQFAATVYTRFSFAGQIMRFLFSSERK